jgi:hypothetical protein
MIDNAFVLSLGLIPAAIGIAVLRYRLYEIDVIIRRTLVYTALVGCLALVYLAGVFGIQTAVRSVSGQSGTLAVTVATLVVAAAFQPLRARIQRAVDHRFYRGRYDAARTLEVFSGRLRFSTSSARRCSRRTRRCGCARRRPGGERQGWSRHGRLRAVLGAVPVRHDVRRSRQRRRPEQQLVSRRPMGRNRLPRGGLHLPSRGLASRGSPAGQPNRASAPRRRMPTTPSSSTMTWRAGRCWLFWETGVGCRPSG